MTNIKSIFELQEFIDEAIDQLVLPLEPKELYEPIAYILNLGGKRLRPLMLLMVADMYGIPIKKILPQAIGIELFHNFTLIHDDIMDQAPIRRGMVTVHEKWSTNTAILSGDALYVKAYEFLLKADPQHLQPLIHLFNQTATEVCEGQQLDMNFESIEVVSMDEYIHMVKHKTAVLLACSLNIGALCADAPNEDQENLYQFGIFIGIAFQFMDDILDVYGDQKNFGKQLAGDILCNKKTCLYIRAYERADSSQKKILDHYFAHQDFESQEKISNVLNVYNSLKVRESCEEIMQEYYATAMNHLDFVKLPNDRKSSLIKFIDVLMVRLN